LTVARDPARGTMKITVEVPMEDGEVIVNAIERVADATDAAIGLEFAAARKLERVRDSEAQPSAANGWRAQRADALLAIAKGSLAGDRAVGGSDAGAAAGPTAAAAAADHYQVVVHVDDSALRGGVGRSDLPIDTVRRLACDGSLVTVVEDERGTPLDVGRKQRTVSTPLKRALWSRDRGCTFPGCRNTRYVDAHHIRHWADGGDTSLENLTLLCSHHHRALHEGRFAVRHDAHGAIYFRVPTAARFRRPATGSTTCSTTSSTTVLTARASPPLMGWSAPFLPRPRGPRWKFHLPNGNGANHGQD
jgi:hypothetical protein